VEANHTRAVLIANAWHRPLSARAKLNDPKTHAPAVVNVYNSTEYGGLLPNGSATIDALIKHMVPSGIVAVGHAQERGYAYAYCG
jgi:hypothetical protein